MSLTVMLTLDEETAAYLTRLAADQGRTPAEVAAWIVTEDLRRERVIDAELLARQDDIAVEIRERSSGSRAVPDATVRRERAGA